MALRAVWGRLPLWDPGLVLWALHLLTNPSASLSQFSNSLPRA